MDHQNHNFSAINNRISHGAGRRVHGTFQDWTISSAFQPIYSLSHRNPVGYEALCRARTADGRALSPQNLFGHIRNESDDVLLDRLCRAVHIKNFSTFADEISWIFLNVNPLVTVVGKNYGSFFRDMLAHNQISPSQVVIEILEQNIHDESILSAAVNYYKELGCLVAIDDFGASHSNFDRIWNLQPDIVKFDRSIVVQAEASQIVRKALPSMVSLIQELGCITLMEGVETEQQALIALDANVDMVQGYYFGHPRDQLVDYSHAEDWLPKLCGKHAEFANAARIHYRDTVGRCVEKFGSMLARITAGAPQSVQLCGDLLALPNVLRIYYLDEYGFQIGANVTNKPTQSDPRFRPLAEAAEANWSRRYYFRQAMLNPGETQISRPYRSLSETNQCITISALIATPHGNRVVCVDLRWE